MISSTDKFDDLYVLLDDLCDGSISADAAARLDRILRQDPAARREYISYLEVHAGLGLISGKPPAADDAASLLSVGAAYDGAAVELPRQPGVEPPRQFVPESRTPNPESPFLPSLAPLPSPLSPPFVGGPVFSYMVATLVLCAMLLGAWAYTITHHQRGNLVDNSRGQTAPGDSAPQSPEMAFVGRVTGMRDCRWSDPRTATIPGAAVPLGRNYVLSSGLMEITYKSGARVILEGPCDFAVESDAGGFLSLGKLTARVEVAKPQAVKTQDPRPKTQDQNSKSPSSLILHPSSLFTVRTPTAVVTDLGTEFGVEVAENGDTTSHVFQGKVAVMAGDAGMRDIRPATEVAADGRTVQLSAGESVLVSRVRETHQESTKNALVRFTHPTTPPKFVRRLFEPPKQLDLLDIVAGGNGTGRRRERGIDPISGWEDAVFARRAEEGGDQYRPVSWHRPIDGVFVPDGGKGTVQLDSAGHAFDGFPDTSGRTCGSLWARAAEVKAGDERAKDFWNWVYCIKDAGKFMPLGRGLLALHANSGITFDLAALRKLHSGARPARFRATAGMADASGTEAGAGKADLWIFVDGRLKIKREKLGPTDDAFAVDMELGPNDRFLTLAATDGGDGITSDWLLLGDPLLDMTAAEEEKK